MVNKQENRLLQDQDLIAGITSGDESAFRELMNHYQSTVFACTMAITRNRDDAFDAAQEAFIRFHKNIKQFDPSRPLKPYLLRIAANCSRNLITEKIRQRRIAEMNESMEIAAENCPQTEMIANERNRLIHDLVNQLPNTLREVTSLFYLAECSCKEVAEVLEMTESAVKVALHRARKKLFADMTEWRTV